MQKCKDDEHTWLVIGWTYGRYNEKGQFTESQQPNLFAMRAKEFMCQKCLTKTTMSDIELDIYARKNQS